MKHVKIACQQIRIGRVKALIHLEIDACVLDFARSLVGVVFFKNDFFAALVRLQLVRAVADRFLYRNAEFDALSLTFSVVSSTTVRPDSCAALEPSASCKSS